MADEDVSCLVAEENLLDVVADVLVLLARSSPKRDFVSRKAVPVTCVERMPFVAEL